MVMKTQLLKIETLFQKETTNHQKTNFSKNDIIRVTDNRNKMCVARIINRAAKATKKYKMCCNVEYEATPNFSSNVNPSIDLND